jgi:hypothetical protein
MNNDLNWINEYSITAIQQPKVVGWWVLYPQTSPTTQFAMYYKPTDEQIKNTEQLLGWGWKDAT